MNVIQTPLQDALLFEPKVFGDARGFFVETYRAEWFLKARTGVEFVQDNQSRSGKGVLRGLHYQMEHTQGKLVRCARGSVYDVIVDLRRGSPSFGQWHGVILDDVHHRQLYVPPGFAHGFCVTSAEADFCYKCTDYYHAHSEAGILWNDPDLGIDWPKLDTAFQLSTKDQTLPRLRDQVQLFTYAG